MLRRLRLAMGLLFLWPEVAGCGGYAIADTGGTAGTMSTGGAGSGGSGGNVATEGSAGAGGEITEGSAGAGGEITGGSGGTGGEALCSNVTPCGGDVVGTWTVTSSCLTASGEIDMRWALLPCSAQLVSGSLQVSGTWTANGDGTFSDDTRTTGSHQLELGEDCKELDATPITCEHVPAALHFGGYADGSCVDNATTGGCTCDALIDQPGTYYREQTGAIGFAPNPALSSIGSYTTADNVLTIGPVTYSYCVSGTRLRLTPASADWTGTLVGSVELQR